MGTTTTALTAAQQSHRAGDLCQAEQLYEQILQTAPDRMEALHGLGAIAYQRGQYEDAIIWLRQAVAADETNAILQNNLARGLSTGRTSGLCGGLLLAGLAAEAGFCRGLQQFGQSPQGTGPVGGSGGSLPNRLCSLGRPIPRHI